MKLAVLINGIATPVGKEHFLVNWFQKNGYDVKVIEPLLGENALSVNKEPEAIIAWSLGGLLAPKLAKKYPKAKLILIASGAKVEPKEKTAKILFKTVKSNLGQNLLYLGFRLPKNWLVLGYKKINQMSGNKAGIERLLIENVDFFRGLKKETIKEVVEMLRKIDNRKLLAKLKNKTLIIVGKKDTLMPISLAKEMNELIRGSQLKITTGSHFDTIDERDLKEIGEFLG